MNKEMKKPVIVVSACLLGRNCKYSGGNNYHEEFEFLKDKYEIVEVCPEVMGGLSIPRDPSEIVNGVVTTCKGVSVDKQYRDGARAALEKLENKLADVAADKTDYSKVAFALLQSRSPSCGTLQIYDGTFSGTRIPGRGIFAQLMADKGIRLVDSDTFLQELRGKRLEPQA